MKKIGKLTNELKVGLVLVAALFLTVFFWSKTADLNVATYSLKTYFTHAEGIKPNSIVALSGIEVGRVEKVNFVYDPEPRVELALLLDKNARLRKDAVAFIAATGFIGDSYVGLTFGSKDSPFAADGDMIQGEDPVEMRVLMKKAEGIAQNLDLTLTEFRQFAQNLNGVVGGNKPNIDNMIKNLEQTAVNFNEFSEDIKAHPWKLLMKGKETESVGTKRKK